MQNHFAQPNSTRFGMCGMGIMKVFFLIFLKEGDYES